MKKQLMILAFMLIKCISILNAQCMYEGDTIPSNMEAKSTTEAKNGWFITSTGTIRILVIYVEVNYNVSGAGHYPSGSPAWSVGQLPNYKDDLFDLNWTGTPQAKMTKYFAECSLNNYKVLGDYVNTLITVNESDLSTVNPYTIEENAVQQINQLGVLNTHGGSTITDLDQWNKKSYAGAPNISGADSPYSYDHVMFIFRNYHAWGASSGSVSTSSMYTALLGYYSDTFSNFNGGGEIPFNILRHEFSHLLFGSNSFHTSGSHSVGGTMFIPNQLGWSMMGGSGSSFQTCNAWDRDRMDWKGPGKTMSISAMNTGASEVNGDLDATNSTHSGTYVLRDFITTGDALRIKLPFIPSTEYQEYIWIENHQTGDNNGSDFDYFIYENSHPSCMDNSTPGLYMYLQAGKDIKTNTTAYSSQYGHYLRFIPADGMHDLQLETTQLQNFCVSNGNWFYPFEKLNIFSNPLTGSMDLEHLAKDISSPFDVISRAEHLEKVIEKVGSQYHTNLPYLGHSRHAFKLNGNSKIGLGTNPSASSMLTLERNNFPFNSGKDNRIVRLNGVSIEIIEELIDGSIKVKVEFDKTDVENDVRWAANEIQLPAIIGSNGYSLNLKQGKTMSIDQGYTPTKIDNPITIGGNKYFVDRTKFTVESGAYFHVEQNAKVDVLNGSTLHLKTGSKMELESGAILHINKVNSKLIIDDGAELYLKPGAKLIIDEEASMEYNNYTANKGLLVGSTSYTGNPAIVEVEGSLTFSSTAKWEHYRDGYYRFYPTHSLTIASSNIPIKFTGKGKTRKMVELANNTTLSISSVGDMDWNTGLIHYGSNAKIVLEDVNFSSISCTYNPTSNPQTTSTAVELISPRATFFNGCDFNKLNKGVIVRDADAAYLVHVQTGKFTDMTTYGVELDNVDNFKMTNGFVNGAVTCFYAYDSEVVEFSGAELKNATYGAKFENVAGAYFTNHANVHDNGIGVYATASLVFLRSGAKVHTNDNGVEIYGAYDSGLGNYNTMLTMGDIGCGSVYNNSNYGIYGVDALLNIDAVQHSIDRGDNIIRPNRFDNNAYKTFEICYGSSTYAPSQINAKGNFWGVSPPDIQSSQYTFVANVCAAQGGTPVYIPLIHTDYSTCVPTTSCMDCSSGGGGGSSSSSSMMAVQSSFSEANEVFVEEDNSATRNGFTNLSAVELIKDTVTDTWKGKSVSDVLFNLEKESVHLIQVSKAIKAKANNSTGRMMYIVEDVFKDVKPESLGSSSTVSLYPNPTNDVLFIDVERVANYSLVIYNLSGQKVLEQTLTDKHNLVNVNNLPVGTYFYELSAPNSNTVKGNIAITK